MSIARTLGVSDKEGQFFPLCFSSGSKSLIENFFTLDLAHRFLRFPSMPLNLSMKRTGDFDWNNFVHQSDAPVSSAFTDATKRHLNRMGEHFER